MNDIEKAISAIKNIENFWTYRPSEVEAAKLAIAALEKQMPKKLITKYECGKLPNDTAYCPSCNAYLSIHHKYCFNCGQSLERD